jgi:hypothetical protein
MLGSSVALKSPAEFYQALHLSPKGDLLVTTRQLLRVSVRMHANYRLLLELSKYRSTLALKDNRKIINYLKIRLIFAACFLRSDIAYNNKNIVNRI